MTLDDRAADGQADAHAAALGRVEGLEEAVHAPRVEAHPRILHGQPRAIAFASLGPDHQLPRTVLDGAHRLRGVQEQVQDDLLELHAVARDGRKFLREFRPQDHPAPLEFAAGQRDHLPRGLVQVHRLRRRGLLREERAQPGDHVGRAVAVADRAPRGLARAVDVRRIGGQHAQAGAGVGDDARQRLVDLVRDRGGQGPEGRDPGHVGELRPRPAERLFREPSIRHVLDRADVLQPAIPVTGPVGDHLQVLHRAIGHLQPVLVPDLATTATRTVHHLVEGGDVVRVDPRPDQLERHRRPLVELEDPIELL
jgi:hypothetical protein